MTFDTVRHDGLWFHLWELGLGVGCGELFVTLLEGENSSHSIYKSRVVVHCELFKRRKLSKRVLNPGLSEY